MKKRLLAAIVRSVDKALKIFIEKDNISLNVVRNLRSERVYIYALGGDSVKRDDGTLIISFLCDDVAFKVFTGVKSITSAFSESWMDVKGFVDDAVRITYVLERFEEVMFPRSFFPHLFRYRSRFPLLSLWMLRVRLLFVFLVNFIMSIFSGERDALRIFLSRKDYCG